MPTTYSSQPSNSVDTIQRYGRIMWDVIKTYFPVLWSAPNSFYIMMATMELESSYRILHGPVGGQSANHSIVGTTAGVGYSYWNDQVIVPLKTSTDPNILNNINEGLSGKALMATLGMYQVRNCRESNALIIGNYRTIAESLGLMVNPGQSISAIFTNDDTGARNSMILGGMVMETKYVIRRKKNAPDVAIRLAVGDYLGKAGVKDVLGTTPEMRVDNIFSGNNGIGKSLTASRVFSNTTNYYKAPIVSTGQTETKASTVAVTDNIAIGSSSCNRLG